MKAAVHSTDFLNVEGESSNHLEAGDEVIAIGHPHGLRFTSTRGIVSSPKRRYGQDVFIQHDVAINPGNSGGPLIDDRGKLAGINTFIRKDAQGLGFAIPSQIVQTYLASVVQAMSDGQIVLPTDEEILESEIEITPEEALNTALESYDGERKELENGGQLLTTSEGHTIAVWIRGEIVECCSHVADLSKASLRDANLLRQLLELNDKIVQPKFCIDSNGELWIKSLRFKSGMDTAEAYSLIGNVIHVVSNYCESIEKYLEDE